MHWNELHTRAQRKQLYLWEYTVSHLAQNLANSAVYDVPPVHDGLEDGGEGRHPDPGPYEHRVLGVEYLTSGSSKGTVDEDVKRFIDLSDINIILSPCLAPRPVKVVRGVFLRDPVKDEVVGGAKVSFFLLHNGF